MGIRKYKEVIFVSLGSGLQRGTMFKIHTFALPCYFSVKMSSHSFENLSYFDFVLLETNGITDVLSFLSNEKNKDILHRC